MNPKASVIAHLIKWGAMLCFGAALANADPILYTFTATTSPTVGSPAHLVRIPMKKIIHSELMTITAWPGDAVESIVEQVIVMGQEGGGNRAALFRFCRFWLRWSRKVCLSTPLGIHLFDARREISPVVQIEFHGGGLLDDVREVMQAGQRRAALVIE